MGEPSLSAETLAALPIDDQVRLVRHLRLLGQHGLPLGRGYMTHDRKSDSLVLAYRGQCQLVYCRFFAHNDSLVLIDYETTVERRGRPRPLSDVALGLVQSYVSGGEDCPASITLTTLIDEMRRNPEYVAADYVPQLTTMEAVAQTLGAKVVVELIEPKVQKRSD